MSISVSRAAMSPILRTWRAYFAPVNRVSGAPAIFDPARDGAFDLDAPPAPWIDAGVIENFTRTQNTQSIALRAGVKGAPTAQVRSELDGRVELDFRQWGKLQMALSGAGEHLNVLAEAPAAPGAPCGGTAAAAIPLQPGSSATELVVGSPTALLFNSGDLIAVDIDYSGQTGFVGTAIAAAYIKSPGTLDADFIRRCTFNVARVSETTATSLKLAQPLLGGVPPLAAKAQKVIAFADREGGTFVPEWSALFVLEGESGGRLCFYYPRLQPCAPARESYTEIADPLRAVGLHATFIALPFTDMADGEPALCWRSYFPATSAAVY